MKMAAQEHLKDFPQGNILMVFMPTARSSDKKHLESTQKERIEMLEIFCTKLREEFGVDSRIHFQASNIEYELYPIVKNTATIYTIEHLRELYPTATLTLTMGLDNLFDLPYWKDVGKYNELLAKIYVPNRVLEEKDIAKTTEFEGGIRFTTIAPSWSKATVEGQREYLTQLMSKVSMLPSPPPTSSSMLRCALHIGDKEKVDKLIGPIDDISKWDSFYEKIKDIPGMFDKCDSFLADYAKAFNTQQGGRKKRKQTKRRNMKKKRTQRKK
jgi:nicotinic acid mononucleotide adenylyltransferase